MKKSMAVDVKQFSFQYRTQKCKALENISFSVEDGDFVSIIGPNGSGKTTLLQCLNKILPYGKGGLFIFESPLPRYSQRDLAQKVSYVPQNNFVDGFFSAFEFVMMGRYPYLSPFSIFKKEDKEICIRALDQTGALEFKDRFLHTLSGGERQKVFIASALAQGAKILLLDEPTLFLDPKSQFEIYDLLTHLNEKERITILLVTHDINNAVRYGKKVLALKKGLMSYWGESKNFMTNKNLENLFSTSFYLIEDSKKKIKLAIKS